MIEFVWDDAKNLVNIEKHGVSFDDAGSAFSDENGILIFDKDHSVDEDRYVLIAALKESSIIVVCHTSTDETSGVETIRIISARKANSSEKAQYLSRTKRR